MRQAIGSLLCAIALLVTGACAETEGTTYGAPVEKVYEKLASLDMGADISSATFMYHDRSLPTATETNKSVSWHMGGKKGSDIVAHLTPVSDEQTKVVVEVKIPPENFASMPVPLQNMAKNMIRERIAAHLEDRKFDDAKFMNAFYGGNASLVPKEIRDQAMAAQGEYARMRRDQAEMERDGPSMSSSTQRPVKWGEPVTTR